MFQSSLFTIQFTIKQLNIYLMQVKLNKQILTFTKLENLIIYN